MKTKIQKRIMKKRKGFTLIEMVIVITIIGILSSIAVTKYSKIQENAKKNADYATAANLATAAMIAISDGEQNVDVGSLQSKGYIQTIPKSKSNNGHKGFAAQLGVLASFNRVSIAASAITIAGKQWQGNIVYCKIEIVLI